MKWVLLGWMLGNGILFALAAMAYASGRSADEKLGAMIPFILGSGSSVLWLIVLIVWLIAES